MYILAHDIARRRALDAVRDAPAGHVVRIEEPRQKDIHREKYHAMIGDIARQEPAFDRETWKRLLVDQFKADTNNDGFPKLRDYWRRNEIRMMPSLDKQRVIVLGEQTRVFPAFVALAFIAWLDAWGADKGIRFTAPEWEAA